MGWCALAGLSASASGNYVGGVVRPPVRIDSTRYELGKAVFTGKAKLADAPVNAESQSASLAAWQKALPASVQKTVDLNAMAGRLSAAQLDGLRHYLEIRYSLKTSGQ